MKILGLLLVLAVGAALAQPPANILVYHDINNGYGDAVLTAIGNLWPGVNLESYTGQPGGQQVQFNTAFNGTTDWDIVILECWFANTNTIDWPSITDAYDTNTGSAVFFVSNWQFNSGTNGQMALANKMGVTGPTDLMSIMPHYLWDAGHPIGAGISDWSQVDPSIIRKGISWWWVAATPVTGWTPTETNGEAGICVAGDGSSVISGYAPAYSVEGLAIWTNILTFMWGETSLERSTWGEIKTMFD
jgi:hypothetical protein